MLGRKTAQAKLACFFHFIAIHFDPGLNSSITNPTHDIPLKRVDIADFLRLTAETVSCQIAKLPHYACPDWLFFIITIGRFKCRI